MINVDIKTDSHYKVDRKRIRSLINKILVEKGVRGSVDISINIVGNRKMRVLSVKYRDIDESCVVLAFPLLEDKSGISFIYPPDKIIHLGDVVISYPEARTLAASENKMVDEKLDELIEHGIKHLLGSKN